MFKTRSGVLLPFDVPEWRLEALEANRTTRDMIDLRDMHQRGPEEGPPEPGAPLLVHYGPRLTGIFNDKSWRPFRRIAGGDRQYFRAYREPAGFTMIANQTAITGTSEALLWPNQFTSFPAQSFVPGQILCVNAWGIGTTAASTPGTLTVNPRWGTTTGGVSLGISNTTPTLATSLTNVAWNLQFYVSVRTVSDTATSSTVVGGGDFCSQIANTATVPGTLIMGGTAATVDTVSAQALVFGAVLGSASDSLTTQGVSLEVLN